ncbi:MAG: RNA methyltransferase [Saprospiraceae bacterium]|nr:RNA methyltransferase [Bacteroidia bacterium]NNE16390.1 RNA methyltransferase [Saprospiraceae bacterium]NNL93506.1 RNA methyltransferase [Saprospiraceae bacterium]
MSEKRKEKLYKVAANRQNLTVILENVHDQHNIGAVMRTCDAVGIHEVFILYTDARQKNITLSDLKTTSTGVKKWVNIHLYNDLEKCISDVRSKYKFIYATHLDADSKSIYETNLSESVALLFGNEHAGLTEEALRMADGNILIPQVGMAQSLNISVACAVTLYEAFRQRQNADLYSDSIDDKNAYNQKVFDEYLNTHNEAYLRGRLNSKS